MRDVEEETRIIRELARSGSGPDPFSSAVRATRMPMLITDPRQDDNPIVFANSAFARLTGFDRPQIMGRNCRFLQGPATDRAEVARLRTAIKERVPIELELLNYKKDGQTFWNRLLVSPVFSDDGELTYFFASQFDVTLERERLANLQRDRDALEGEVVRRNVELQASEARLRFALKAARLGSWSLDLASLRLIASEGCKKTFGRPLSEPFTYEQLEAAVHPDDREHRDAQIAKAVCDGTELNFEFRIITPAGEERWVQVRGQAAYSADGTPLALGGVSLDVTERRQAEDHRALLANELSHRVKNTLTSLQAIVAQTLRRATSLEDAGKTLEARIQAMAAANALLIGERFESARVDDMLARALAPFGVEDGSRFRIEGPELRLSPRLVVAFALALHELATNATKYGALSTPEGVVRIEWTVVDDGRPHRLQLTWAETGGPPVVPPTRTSFGTQLIQRVLAKEIGGSAEVLYLPEGVTFTAVAPLPETVADEIAATRESFNQVD